MLEQDVFKAEKVVIRDCVEEGARKVIQLDTESPWKSIWNPKTSQIQPSSSVTDWSENTYHSLSSPAVAMETSVDKHQSHFGLGSSDNKISVSEDRTSPASSADLFPTPASSRESLLSEVWDKDKSWFSKQPSSAASPCSVSRTISPCSSVRSGAFSPAVVRIRRHFLAPGSSLVNIPQTCFSSCDSLSSSVCPQIPPARHRPPLTRLSLLTAILRKGRLPILSPALMRPYTPCWPVSPVTLSFCTACSAASSVASVPLEFPAQISSLPSTDAQKHIPSSFICRVPALDPHCHLNHVEGVSVQTCSNSKLRPEHVDSPTLVKQRAASRIPLPQLSGFTSVLPKKHSGLETSTLGSTSQPPSPKRNDRQAHGEKQTFLPSAINLLNEPRVPRKWTSQSSSSLSKLRFLSQRLKSPTGSPPHSQTPETSIAPSACTDTVSPLPPLQNTSRIGRCESAASAPIARSVTPSQASANTHNLSPSRYTTVCMPGWRSPTRTPTPQVAPSIREFTHSPSLSSTPSPRPGSAISDYSDGGGKKSKTHKIKSSYKSLAAIPTNSLLMDQQVIDEQVEKNTSWCNQLDKDVTDTHSEMRSPAQLRQESEELYATIDEILADSFPDSSKSTVRTGIQYKSHPFQKSLGRETKYASVCSLHPSAQRTSSLMDAKKTKPGIIRPMTTISKTSLNDNKDNFPTRRLFREALLDKKKEEKVTFGGTMAHFYPASNEKMPIQEKGPERRSQFSVCELHIKEADEISHPARQTSASFKDFLH